MHLGAALICSPNLEVVSCAAARGVLFPRRHGLHVGNRGAVHPEGPVRLPFQNIHGSIAGYMVGVLSREPFGFAPTRGQHDVNVQLCLQTARTI